MMIMAGVVDVFVRPCRPLVGQGSDVESDVREAIANTTCSIWLASTLGMPVADGCAEYPQDAATAAPVAFD